MSMAMKRKQAAIALEGKCPVDLMLGGIATFLLLYGLVMVGSASLEVGAATYGNAFHLINRHASILHEIVAGRVVLFFVFYLINRHSINLHEMGSGRVVLFLFSFN